MKLKMLTHNSLASIKACYWIILSKI